MGTVQVVVMVPEAGVRTLQCPWLHHRIDTPVVLPPPGEAGEVGGGGDQGLHHLTLSHLT